MNATPPITVTEQDRDRLEAILARSPRSPNVEQLEEELSRATVVNAEEISADIVTMNCKVRFRDIANGSEDEITLVYPKEADAAASKISILAPVGTALLGLKVGSSIEWAMPGGKTRSLEIVSVLYQPEAHGRFDL